MAMAMSGFLALQCRVEDSSSGFLRKDGGDLDFDDRGARDFIRQQLDGLECRVDALATEGVECGHQHFHLKAPFE